MIEIFQNNADNIFTLLGILLSGAVGWFFSRATTKAEIKKKDAEIGQMEAEVTKIKADSSQRIMDQYQEALDDLKNRYEDRYEYLKKEFERRHADVKEDYDRKYAAAQENFKRVIEEIRTEKDAEIEGLKKKIDNLSRSLDYWKKKYKELDK